LKVGWPNAIRLSSFSPKSVALEVKEFYQICGNKGFERTNALKLFSSLIMLQLN
jgi:hypothetical protein